MGLNWVELLCSKIAYAKKRWGCTLFYIDSDVMYIYDYDGKPVGFTLPASVYPNAFTMVKVDTKMVAQKQADIIQGQRSGDVLMAGCWWPSPEYSALKRLRQDARLLPFDRPAPSTKDK
jgi:hypothetical protein